MSDAGAVMDAEDRAIRSILERVQTIALVGASLRPERAAYRVHRFLLDHGYDVHPVSAPHAGKEIHGRRVVATLADLPGPVDMVDVFRRADAAGAVVDEAIAHGAKVVWMQLGVIDEAAAARARDAGLEVVMDRCPAIEYPRLRPVR